MSLKQIILGLLAVSSPFVLNGMIHTALLEGPDERKVLIIGEMHNYKDTEVLRYFVRFIKRVEQTDLTEQLPFVVEYDLKNESYNIVESLAVNALLKVQKEQLGESIAFDFWDPRGKISCNLAALFCRISDLIKKESSSDDFIAAYHNLGLIPEDELKELYFTPEFVGEKSDAITWSNEAQRLKASLRRKNGKVCTSLPKFYEYYDTTFQHMVALLSKYENNEPMTKILKEAIGQFKKAYDLIKIFLDRCKDNTLEERIVSLFDIYTTPEERIHAFTVIHKMFQDNTDYIFADIYFLDRLLSILSKHKCACILVGRDHAVALIKHFKELGYQVGHEAHNEILLQLLMSVFDTGKNLLPAEMIRSFLEPITKDD